MDNEFKLIPHEQIFDLTTQQLQQQVRSIEVYLKSNISSDQRIKAEETVDLIRQQIDDRVVLQEFEALCSRHEQKQHNKLLAPSSQQFIKKFEDFNAQFQQLVNMAAKQENTYKLTLPQIKQEPQHEAQNKSVMRQSKIKILNQNTSEKKKQAKKEEAKIITKPKSVSKTMRKMDTIPSVKSQKNQHLQTRITTKSSLEQQKKHSVVETKKLNLKVVPSGGKKVSKKQTNDWLVQMVRQQQERKIRIKNNSKSETQTEIPSLSKIDEGTQPFSSVQKQLCKEQSTYDLCDQDRLKTISSTQITYEQANQHKTSETEIVESRLNYKLQTPQLQNTQMQTQKITVQIPQKLSQQRQVESHTNLVPKQVKFLVETHADVIIRKFQQPNPKEQVTTSVKELSTGVQMIIQDRCTTSQNKSISGIQIMQEQITTLQHNDFSTQDNYYPKIQMMQLQEQEEVADEAMYQQNKYKKKQQKHATSKACFSQQYWQRVRKQALTNLERVKLMKQLRENQKQQLTNQIKMAQIYEQLTKEQEQQAIQKQTVPTTTVIQVQLEPKEAISLKQITKTMIPKKPVPKKKIPTKKPQPIPLKLPDIIPNYLEIFPTFNHIFHVMYMKPEVEALLDIPIVMKQLIPIFTNHLTSLTNNPSYRRPMFKAFDNTCMYVNDAHQLLLHAQTTNIDLKTLLNRLNIFNQNLHGRFQEKEEQLLYYRVVKSKEEVYDIITTAFLRAKGWHELPHGMNLKTSWNLMWSWAKPEVDFSKLLVFQKINHFPFNKNMSRKDLLYKNLDNFKRICKTNISFVPLTFNLPKQYTQFSGKYHEDQALEGQMNIWIMKPIGKSRGRGIRLINNISDLNYLDNIVVQKYLKNPLLLDGYKFDLRVYVLVTSLHPLEVFIYRQGFARLSTQKYTLNPYSIKNTFIHLTNFSIQRNNKQAQNSTDDGGSKITFKVLQQKLQQKGIRWSAIWQKIHQIIIKSLLACSLVMPSSPSAFQLFGYDVIIDTDNNVHLIQINASPSLEKSYLIDQVVKQSLIDDIMDLMDFTNFDRKECINVMNQRLQRKTPTNSIEDNIDIGRILRFKPIRKVGQMPEKMGLFERVAPSEKSVPLQKIVSSKYNPNIKHIDSWN